MKCLLLYKLLTLIFNAFQVVRKILNNNLDIQIINDIQFKISSSSLQLMSFFQLSLVKV